MNVDNLIILRYDKFVGLIYLVTLQCLLHRFIDFTRISETIKLILHSTVYGRWRVITTVSFDSITHLMSVLIMKSTGRPVTINIFNDFSSKTLSRTEA